MSEYPIISSKNTDKALDDLTDVNVAAPHAPLQGQVLVYDPINATDPLQPWIPGDGGGGGGIIEVPPGDIDPGDFPGGPDPVTSIGVPIYFDYTVSKWKAAQADNIETVHVGVISEVNTTDVVIMLVGECVGIDPLVNGGAPLVPGVYYYLSTTQKGQVTDTRPGDDEIVAPVWQALSTTSALILPYRASKPIVRKSDVFTATVDTKYTLTDAICAAGNLNVYLNGTKLIFGTDFTHDATANTFTLNTPVKSISDVVEAETWKVQ